MVLEHKITQQTKTLNKQYKHQIMRKLLGLSLTMLIIQCTAFCQHESDTIRTALLIVDIQEFYFPGEGPGLVNAEEASLAAKDVLQIIRDNDLEVVHIRHQSSKGFEIHKNVQPLPKEKVITKTEINSFLGTDLLEHLKGKNINRLVIIGMQTQMCLEAAVRAGHDFGFECIVIEDACATRNLKFGDQEIKAVDVQASTFATIKGGGYAKIIELDLLRENPDKYLFQELE